jgi:S1-C subfamily serine protease
LSVPKAIEAIRPSIVQILLLASGFSEDVQREIGRPFINQPIGTGFFVNQDAYVITARHVVEGGRQRLEQIQADRKQLLVGVAQPNTENMRGNFSAVDFDLIEADTRHDLALLRLRRNPFRSEMRSGIRIGENEVPLLFGAVAIDPNRPKDGVAIGISGYPLGQPVLVTNVGCLATSWAFEFHEVSVPGAPQWFTMPEVADTYLADIEVNRGNSGAPVYLIENATVVGVCVGSKPAPVRDQRGNNVSIGNDKLYYSSGLTMLVPVRYVIELLRSHNLNWQEITESPSH